MPELPEVHTIVVGLDAALKGASVAAVRIERPDVIRSGRRAMAARLAGQRIEGIGREGKRIIMKFGGGLELVIHLGMSGRLTLEPKGAAAAKHTHLRIGFAGRADELRFRDPRRFGGVWLVEPREGSCPTTLRPLGPDALSIRVPVLRRVLAGRRQIKALLMDQQAISGLGNIYCDEALFRARIHPRTAASDLSPAQVKALACSIRKTLRASIASGGSTLSDYRQSDGSEGSFQRMVRVYGREGQPCRRCGASIVRTTIAGRGTHTCPRCQPLRRRDRRA